MAMDLLLCDEVTYALRSVVETRWHGTKWSVELNEWRGIAEALIGALGGRVELVLVNTATTRPASRPDAGEGDDGEDAEEWYEGMLAGLRPRLSFEPTLTAANETATGT